MTHPPTLLTTPEAALDAVRTCEADLVLDFDHTLYLDNSTERWLDALRPRTAALLVVIVVDVVLKVLGRLRLCDVPRWRDQCCVAVTQLLFPWSRAAWKRNAAKHFLPLLNPPLLRATLEATKVREITVLSYGFQQVIAPLLAHAPFPARLIASDAFSHDRNMRLHGKLAALEAALDAKRVRAAVFVTDSHKDQDVLDVAGVPALVQWAPYTSPAFDGVYLPMRYACIGKYAGRRYFTTQILQEDLTIWLLAYAWTPASLPTLLLLFLAMYCIYEIGYWKNDHVAAKLEAAPNRSETAARFAHYPIGWAWAWTAAALLLLGVSLVRRPMEITTAAYLVAIVTVVLLLLHGIFTLFNRLTVRQRRFVFPLLHLLKNFLPILLFPFASLGIPLLAAQWVSQVVLYLRHRGRGDAAAFNRQAFRAVLFAGLVLVGGLLYPSAIWNENTWIREWEHPRAVLAGLIAVWLLFRVIQRTHGRRIFSIMRPWW